MAYRSTVLLCALVSCFSRLPSLAASETRAAAVLVREDGTVGLRIAYPPGTSEDLARQDVLQAALDGHWTVTEPQFVPSQTGLTATCRIEEIEGGRDLTVWPLVAALRRFDELVVAYVGPSRAGEGQWANPYVSVSWRALPSGITYTIFVHRRDFTDLADLEGPGPVEAPKPSPWTFAGIVGLAVVASAVTYFLARRAVAPAADEPAPSEEEVRQ